MLHYLRTRLLERMGKYEDAARECQKVLTAAVLPGPLLEVARDLRNAGEPVAAEQILRNGLVENGIASTSAWNVWTALNLCDLSRTPEDILEMLPSPGKEGLHMENLRWLLETLQADSPIRIDCGGEGFVDREGQAWGKDRFFASGSAMGPLGVTVSGTNIAPLFTTFRQFEARDGPSAAYLVPLPRGRYRVTLHFAALHYCVPGFLAVDVVVEGSRVLEDFDPVSAGCRVAQHEVFETSVEDGLLEIHFAPRRSFSVISGLEIENVKERR